MAESVDRRGVKGLFIPVHPVTLALLAVTHDDDDEDLMTDSEAGRHRHPHPVHEACMCIP